MQVQYFLSGRNTRGSRGIQRNPEEPFEIIRNPMEYLGILVNPKQSYGILESHQESSGIFRNPSEREARLETFREHRKSPEEPAKSCATSVDLLGVL